MINFILTLKAKNDEAWVEIFGNIDCPRQHPEGCRGRAKIKRTTIASWLRDEHEDRSLTVAELGSTTVAELQRQLNINFNGKAWTFPYPCPKCGVMFDFPYAMRKFVKASATAYLSKAVSTKGRPQTFSFPTEDKTKGKRKK